jgi:hypothetical protein
MIEFYDSASREFPAGAGYVLLYADGRYKATPAQAARWPHVRWITVLGGTAAAAYAGAADFEPGNEAFDPGRLRAWAEGRKAGHWLARVYCNLANLPAAHKAVGDLPNVRWWLASWGPQKTAAELARESGGLAEAGKIWGQQFAGHPAGGYDSSVLLGTW